jgi:hypothetical protein
VVEVDIPAPSDVLRWTTKNLGRFYLKQGAHAKVTALSKINPPQMSASLSQEWERDIREMRALRSPELFNTHKGWRLARMRAGTT